MARRGGAPKRQRIPGAAAETERALNARIAALESRLARLEAKPGREDVLTSDTNALPGEFLTFEAPSAGVACLLPPPTPAIRNARVTLCFRNSNPVRLVCVGGLVNGVAQVINTAVGTIECVCDGKRGWATYTGLSSSGSATDAGYHVDAPHGSLPNARHAQNSAEVLLDNANPGLVSWFLGTASIALSKLADLTGLSVLGRAANSAGVMAAITASTFRQVLRTNDLGTAIEWGDPLEVRLAGADQGDAYALNFVNGTNTTAAASVVGAVANVSYSVTNFPLTGLANQADGTALANKSGGAAPPSAHALTGLMSSIDGATIISTTSGGIAITGAAASSMTATTGVLNLTSTASSLNCVAGSQITFVAATNITGEATAGDVRFSAPSGGVSLCAGHAEQNPATGYILFNATSGVRVHAGATPQTAAAGLEFSSDTTVTIYTNGTERWSWESDGSVELAGDAGDSDLDVIMSKGNAAPPVWGPMAKLLQVNQVYAADASYTLTPPTGATWFEAEFVGAGGGGGGADSETDGEATAGGGGGAGAYIRAVHTIVSGNITGAIGTGGTAGSNAGGTGGTGGNTTLIYNGTTNTAVGGQGGAGMTAGSVSSMASAFGGLGGNATATFGDVVFDGASGHNSFVGVYSNANEATAAGMGGNGASSFFGGGGRGGRVTNAIATENGQAGLAPGAGGGGGARLVNATAAATGATGGAGADGCMIIRFYTGPVPTFGTIA